MKRFPFMGITLDRHWYFYFLQIISLAPVYLFGYFGIIKRIKNHQSLTEALWVLSYLIGFTIFGIFKCGYQTRYILPAIPALCLLSADMLFGKSSVIWVITGLLLIIGLLTGILTSIILKPVELFPLFDFFKYVRIVTRT